MLYRKNINSWEQGLRVIAGLAMAAYGVLGMGGVWGYGLAAGGLALALTGIFGWCPACAMVRRKLDRNP